MTNKLLFKKVKYSIIKKEDIMTNLKLKLGRQIKHLRKAQNLSKTDYMNKINQNLMFIKDNEEKLKIMYEISSALV